MGLDILVPPELSCSLSLPRFAPSRAVVLTLTSRTGDPGHSDGAQWLTGMANLDHQILHKSGHWYSESEQIDSCGSPGLKKGLKKVSYEAFFFSVFSRNQE